MTSGAIQQYSDMTVQNSVMRVGLDFLDPISPIQAAELELSSFRGVRLVTGISQGFWDFDHNLNLLYTFCVKAVLIFLLLY